VRFHEALAPLRDHPRVIDVRGRGLLAGVHLADDTGEQFATAAFAAGLIVWPNANMVMLAPPYVITEDEIDQLVDRFERALRQVS
jgi:adenosylmethionine-8-amino-7-oxononanoate aminotransferase